MSPGLSQPADFQLPGLKLPILVQLGLTYRCNLKCAHCYALYRRDRSEFTFEEVGNLAHQLYDAGSCALVYSHGENMIRSDFHEIAHLFHELGFYQTLMLNGFYVRDHWDAERLVEDGINRTLVSLDSTDQGVHDAVRGRTGAFDVALGALERLRAAGIPTVGISTTIDVHNYDEVEGIVEFAVQRGLDAISFMQNRYNRPRIFDRAVWPRYRDVCARLYELILAYRRVIDIYTHDPFMLTMLDDRLADGQQRDAFIGSNLCNVGTSMVSIDPVGNVTGCNFIDEVIGNVREEPIADIWARLVLRYSDDSNPPVGPCTSCRSRPVCMGGCKAFHYKAKYDERCGTQRFVDRLPHGLAIAGGPTVMRDPTRAPGTFVGMPRRQASNP